MKNAAVAEKSHSQEALESLRSAFAAERDRRLNTVDPDEAHALVCCAREAMRLTAIAVDLNESSETRLEAAMRGLDLAGMTARSARFRDCDPGDLTLLELHNALARIEFEMCDEAA
jgi:hypothetical protein